VSSKFLNKKEGTESHKDTESTAIRVAAGWIYWFCLSFHSSDKTKTWYRISYRQAIHTA